MVHLQYKTFLGMLACACLVAGCGPEVETYSVARQDEGTARPAVAPGMPGGTSNAPAAASGVRWGSPEQWQELPASGMRLGSFQVESDAGTGDVSVIVLAGDGGGLVSNINRWRGQIGLAPATEEEIRAGIEEIEIQGGTVLFVELRGPDGGDGILGGLLDWEGQTWFFKMTAPDAMITENHDIFRAWLQTVEVSGNAELE